MASRTETEPVINENPQLQSYYHSLESRAGYRFFLGGTRHFGYYENDTYWPFPFDRALRRMEDQLAAALNLPNGSRLLDAGCGVGNVAVHLAGKFGFEVKAIDIVEHHLEKANRNIARAGLGGKVTTSKMDYHHLESLEDGSFDGVYTFETFVHATDPEGVLKGFYRLLRPGGRIAMFEYDHQQMDQTPKNLASSLRSINEFSAMPMNDMSHPGVFKELLEGAGFTDVVVRDYSKKVMPMIRIFYLIGYIPFIFISLFGLERHFINTVAGVQAYRGQAHWRYISISATKPSGN